MERVSTSWPLRLSAGVIAAFIVVSLSWQVAAAAGAVDRTALQLFPGGTRAAPEARGISFASRVVTEDDATAAKATLSGKALVLSQGVPLTLIDGGTSLKLRAPQGSTVADLLTLARVQLGPMDRVLGGEGKAFLDPGDVVRVQRFALQTVVARESVGFPVQTVNDSTMAKGKVVVVTAGAPGTAENTYSVKTLDGAEVDRELVSSVVLTAPTAEVRRVGTYVAPVAAPAYSGGGGDIPSIIVAAANRWGASADQLLRVARCESGYNPNAYNASSGASGLFQFLASTWAANSVRAGYGGYSVFDPVANANTAAMMFANGQAGQWVCK